MGITDILIVELVIPGKEIVAMIGFSWLNVTPERYRIIKNEITKGSEPGIRFYIMVAVSTLIAGFGLGSGVSCESRMPAVPFINQLA